MSLSKPDHLLPRQFCRRWDARPVAIKLLCEMTERDWALLEIDYGERAVAALPAHVLRTLDAGARRELVRTLGRHRVAQLKNRRERERATLAAANPGGVDPRRCAEAPGIRRALTQ
jgi:hypothetical protein